MTDPTALTTILSRTLPGERPLALRAEHVGRVKQPTLGDRKGNAIRLTPRVIAKMARPWGESRAEPYPL
jgi:hypothetical protein